MPVPIGKLDRRITIERFTEGATNDFNEPTKTWSTLVTVWAKRMDLRDSEKFAAGQDSAAIRSRFVIRSTATTRGVKATDRLLYDSKYWQILGVKETEHGRNHFLEITASAEID